MFRLNNFERWNIFVILRSSAAEIGNVAQSVLFENDIHRERQLEGIKNSTKKAGRKPKFSQTTIENIATDRDNLIGISKIMKEYKISENSVYRLTNHLVKVK